jgi:hypothetical protein
LFVGFQIVFWNVAGNYNDESWQNDQWETEQLFWVVPPGTQPDAINRPWVLSNTVQPTVANSWSVQSGATATVTVTVATTVSITALCEGTYTTVISARGANGSNALNKEATAGVLWRIVYQGYAGIGTINGLSASSSLVNEFFPRQSPTFGNSFYQVLGHNWADLRYMLKSFQVSITGPRWVIAPLDPADSSQVRNTLGVAVVSTDNGAWGATPFISTVPGSNTATFSATYNLSDSTAGVPLGAQFSYTPGVPATGGPVGLSVGSTNTAVLINTEAQYKWEAVGPFVDLTVQITDATEYPTLSSANIMLTPNGTFDEQNTVYMLKNSDPLVYQMGASVSGVTAALRFAAPSVVPVQDSHITTSYLLANPDTTQSVAAAGFAAAVPVVPTHMSTFFTAVAAPGTGSATPGNLPVQWSGSSGLARPYVAFVQFTGTACSATNANAHIFYMGTVRASFPSALVECASHYDCAGQPGNHPSQDRAQFSANGNANRFSTCYLYNDVTGFGRSKPSTRCMECAPRPAVGTNNDLECNEGQFCWVDYGLCPTGTGTDAYVCDNEANSWIGTCRNKSTQVLGKSCRAVETARVTSVVTNGAPGAGTGASRPDTLGATFRDLDARNGFAPGAGFCGEVRYLNDTGVGAVAIGSTTPQFRLNGTVRTTLWTGSCVAGRCMECNPSSFPSDTVVTSGKTCVNGYLVTPVTVDNTLRTLVFNTTGSAAAVTASFAVLLFLIALCSMQNAGNRHRELYGEDPMSFFAILKAVTYEWMCCLKRQSERSRVARYIGAPGRGASVAAAPAGATSSTPLTGTATSTSGATVNPLDGKQAQDWGTRT